jgi:tRNA G18 (ribose-2'-O)-methylase SpoU
VPIYRSDAAGFQQITGFNIHRGCLALVRRPSPQPWREIASAASLVVVLEAVTDADNVGSVFRNAAAFEAQAVLLSPGCCDPLYRKAIRTSMGAVLAVPFARLEQWPADIAALRDAGFLVVALSPQEPSIALDDFALSRAAAGPVALMLGTEGAGLSAGAEAQAAVRVRIPIASMVDSLNVAAASAVALHAIRAGASRSTRD